MLRSIALAATLVALAGCTPNLQPIDSQPQTNRAQTPFTIAGDTTLYVSVVADKETGCQYVVVSFRDATVTPRLNGAGQPMCGSE